MLKRGRKGRGPRSGDNGAHWISYSDMMASLLLVFVLAVVYSVYQYYSMLEIKTQQLNEQQAELDRATITLVQREEELEAANVTLMGKQEELAAIQIQLDQQENDLHAAQDALKTKEEEQARLQLQLAAMQSVLEAQRAEMLSYQHRIDDMIGVRSKIIQELSQALSAANVGASVDAATGDIILEGKVFFDSSKDTIRTEGQELLSRFVPVYLGVLMRPEYVDYVGEIVIEGHTDTAGSYLTNLRLSQNRALSVAEYCLQLPSLSSRQVSQLQELLTAKGRSFSDPIYKADGSVDMDASRRVEFKFRLKDSEMIQEMDRILTQMEAQNSL
ncbi:MAG: OmpA family protein [Clostridia bacterium]|nr:OmpA family protein [Clostridia bacterium]